MIASDLFLYAWFYFTEIKKIRPVGLRHQPNATLTSPSTTDYLTQILLFFQKVMRSTPESPRYYFLNCPPRLGKTTLLHLFLTFQFISNPVSHSMYFTCSQILAQDVTPKVSEIISSPFFRQLAGYIRPDPKCNNKDIIKTIYRNEASGFKGQIVCATMDSTATGFGAGNKPALLTELFLENGGILGIDDPIKAQDADNPDRQLDVFNHFKSAIESRTNRYTVPILCTGHRTDAEDLFYHIKKDLKPSDYEELIIPVMDVNTGKTINSHLYPTKTMRYFEKSNPIVFYAQYMQAPIKAEGSLFNVDKIQIAQNRPLEENILYSFIACDTASSSHAKADFSVFIHFYVIARKNWREFAIKDEKTNKWKFE
ncbi:MAG: hypothetical protein EBU01_15325, partial [Crocinitomicaceae bacterium]|nr:hypothetical protein [Crocinitomicaceae bacterium]